MSGEDGAAKLLAKVIDRMDRVLFEHDLEFKDGADWELFAERVRQLVFEFYDDNGDDEDDADFDPNGESSSSSDSVSLEASTAEDESRKRKHE